jgi:hypothetical protein
MMGSPFMTGYNLPNDEELTDCLLGSMFYSSARRRLDLRNVPYLL